MNRLHHTHTTQPHDHHTTIEGLILVHQTIIEGLLLVHNRRITPRPSSNDYSSSISLSLSWLHTSFFVVYTRNQFETNTMSFFTTLFPSSTLRHDSWSLYGCPKPRSRESRNSHVTRGIVYNICLFSNASFVSPSDSCHAHVHPCVSRLTAIFGLLHSSRTKQHEERSVPDVEWP